MVDDLNHGEVVRAAAWLRDNARDPDVSAAIAGCLERLGCSGLAELSRSYPDEMFALVDGLQAMLEQIPEDETWQVGAIIRKSE